MTLTATKIVFAASLGSVQIENQTVSLGGIYPDVEIEFLNDAEETHRFKIQKNIPNLGDEMLNSVAAEASQQIEVFWNVLAFLLDASIIPSGIVHYEVNGVLKQLRQKQGNFFFGGKLVSSTGVNWFSINAASFHKRYDYDLLKRYNFARALPDPISRFLSLYAMLASIANDRQATIDAFIEKEEPTVSKSYSPNKGTPETIFTRLRNELAHHREGVSAFDTHNEIRLHISRFEWIVGRILRPKIEGTA